MRPGWHSLIFLVLTLAMSVPVRAETIQIRIDKMEYSPAEVRAKVGDTVEWINADILAHTATVKGDWEIGHSEQEKRQRRHEEGRGGGVLLPLPPEHEGTHRRRRMITPAAARG